MIIQKLKKLKFSHEPILWVGFFVILIQFINNIIQHRPIDASLISALIGAAGAVFGRSLVTPVIRKDKDVLIVDAQRTKVRPRRSRGL